jgi:hypothetical protein
MSWSVVLHIFDCKSTSTNLAGAIITGPDVDPNNKTTDANGNFRFAQLDGVPSETVMISKPDYIPKNWTMNDSENGQVLEVCLDHVDPGMPPDANAPPTGRGGNCCFTGDTRITLSDGSETPIALVRKGDLVLGRSGQPNRVVGIERPLLGGRKLYALNGGVPFVTAEHPFLTEAGWKAIDPEATAAENPYLVVGRLAVKDVLLRLQGCAVAVGSSGYGESIEVVLEPISLVSLKARHADPATPLYNLLLDGDHAYFANGLIVHNKCFIVSATTGSSESVEVIRLRQLRDRVAMASRLGSQLIDRIYCDYYQFSPEIAAELEHDVSARNTVLWVIVRPLLAWYTLAGMLALEEGDPRTVNQGMQDVSNACPQYLGGSLIITLLEAIGREEVLPANTPPLFFRFESRLREAARLRYASWAILDPLFRAWRSMTDHLDLVEEVAQWLATAPLDAIAPPSDPEVLNVELGVLADFFNFKPNARRQLGERLTAAWPDTSDALERAGFLSQTPIRAREQ